MSQTFGLTMDLTGVLGRLDADATAMEEAARPAAQAGAQVLYEQVTQNVEAMGRKSGNLRGSIYQKHSPEMSVNGVQFYRISWNAKKAPHGHLLEWGWLQRYIVVRKPNGTFRPLVRPEMRGKKPPGRRASQAQKDAYYVMLPGGPRQIPGRSFVRSAISAFPRAQTAMEVRYIAELKKRGVIG